MKTKIFFLMLFVACVTANGQTQTAKIDSLENLLQTHSLLTTEQTIKIYDKLSYEYLAIDIERAAELALTGLQLAIKHDEWYFAGYFYSYLGLSHYYSSRYDSCMVYFEQMLSVAKQMKQEKIEKSNEVEADANSFIGITYDAQGRLKEAIEYYLKSLDIAEKNKLTAIKNLVLVNLGRAYYCLKNYDKALEYYEKSIELRKELNDSIHLVYDFTGMATVYREQQKYDKALKYAEAANYITEHFPKVSLESRIFLLQEWAEILIKSETDYDKALEKTQKALQYAEKWNSPVHIANSLRQMSFVYLKQGKYALSEQTALRALSTDSVDLFANMLLYEYIGKANIMMGNKEKSMTAFDQQISLSNAYSNKNYQSALSEMEVKYETEKKEMHIASLESEKRLMWTIGIGGGIVLFAIIMLLLYIASLRNRRNRILAEMNATKDKFFSIISHDLKNPAIAQRNALQLLVAHANQLDTTSLETHFSELLKSADNQVKLLYSLLNWAQVQTGRIVYTPALLNLTDDLRADVLLIKSQAESKGIAFTTEMPAEVLVTGDSDMLVTVVRNLLTNAVKFTHEGGSVRLKIETTEGKTLVAVEDSGIGMSEDTLRRLFQIDRQHMQRGTAGETGSGLGLIVCKEFLGMHRSTLHIDSREGAGSKFWFKV
jgi:signal transduction histidine kinase/prefoldin subunit 5